MPQLGETVTEGKIVKWFKSAGDAVKPGDNLFEIETDKTSMEVPATSAGTLQRHPFQRRRGGESRRRGGGDCRCRRDAGEERSASSAQSRRQRASGPRQRRGPRCAATSVQARAQAAHRAARSLERSAQPRTQFRAGQDLGRHIHHAARAPPGLRARHRSLAHLPAPARMAASSRATSKRRRRRAPRWRPAPAPRR